jgi:hypothetical protein
LFWIGDHKWTNSKKIKFAITDLTANFGSSIVMGKGLGEVKITFEFKLKAKDGEEVFTSEPNFLIVSLCIYYSLILVMKFMRMNMGILALNYLV